MTVKEELEVLDVAIRMGEEHLDMLIRTRSLVELALAKLKRGQASDARQLLERALSLR